MGKRRWYKALILGLLGLVALAQTAESLPPEPEEGFFDGVLSGMEEMYGDVSPPPPDPILESCYQAGLPTALRVTQVGTVESPFCPGQVEARATASGYWVVSIEDSSPGTEAVKSLAVRSDRTTPVKVKYRYNPPDPPASNGPDATIYRFDPNTGRWEPVADYYGQDPFGYWASNYDPQNTTYCTSGQTGCP
ncbi:MAG: hypothetical protein ACK4G4_12155 [Thermus sp.]|uniref:hypothetical protein n=1 Tax=Thermus sp. TaxID=275 RepID=UPI00391956C8